MIRRHFQTERELLVARAGYFYGAAVVTLMFTLITALYTLFGDLSWVFPCVGVLGVLVFAFVFERIVLELNTAPDSDTE